MKKTYFLTYLRLLKLVKKNKITKPLQGFLWYKNLRMKETHFLFLVGFKHFPNIIRNINIWIGYV